MSIGDLLKAGGFYLLATVKCGKLFFIFLFCSLVVHKIDGAFAVAQNVLGGVGAVTAGKT